MPAMQWDRLMETCVKENGRDILLTAGLPPQLRLDRGLASLQVPPLDQKDVEEMVESFRRPPATVGADPYDYNWAEGYRYLDVTYRDGQVFRAAVFGQFPSAFILLMRLELKGDLRPAEGT